MKKAVFSFIGLIVVVTAVVFNGNLGYRGSSLSDIALANVEALASSEGGSGILNCYQTISYSGDGNATHQTYCGECTAKLCRSWSSSSTCNF